jgi:hypothetical protein
MTGPISVSKTFPSMQSTSAQNILKKLKTKIYRYKEDIKDRGGYFTAHRRKR